ncbi:hypothetical protein LTR50_005110 [Elasticomyces elasticus]|nr:hypothetical protein LTR50_005110 [Elasticomyces elasticus]
MLRQSSLSSLTPWVCRRNVASFRRTKNALRVRPDPSFTETAAAQDHIIFNPPSSAPNVYHTPLIFLPLNDPRRRLHMRASSLAHPAAAQPAPHPLPPPVRPEEEKKYHLTPEEIAEIRRLRAEDPRRWTRVRLAEKFGCSQFFVSLCCSAPEIKEERDRDLEAIKKKWGRRKTEAREERQRRKEGWGRNE